MLWRDGCRSFRPDASSVPGRWAANLRGVAAIGRTHVTSEMPDGHWLATPQGIYYANLETREMSRWTWGRVVSLEDKKRRGGTWIHLEVDDPTEAIDLLCGELSARKMMGSAINYLVEMGPWQPAGRSSDLIRIVDLLVDLYSESWFESPGPDSQERSDGR